MLYLFCFCFISNATFSDGAVGTISLQGEIFLYRVSSSIMDGILMPHLHKALPVNLIFSQIILLPLPHPAAYVPEKSGHVKLLKAETLNLYQSSKPIASKTFTTLKKESNQHVHHSATTLYPHYIIVAGFVFRMAGAKEIF